jgi:hypothetical protein
VRPVDGQHAHQPRRPQQTRSPHADHPPRPRRRHPQQVRPDLPPLRPGPARAAVGPVDRPACRARLPDRAAPGRRPAAGRAGRQGHRGHPSRDPPHDPPPRPRLPLARLHPTHGPHPGPSHHPPRGRRHARSREPPVPVFVPPPALRPPAPLETNHRPRHRVTWRRRGNKPRASLPHGARPPPRRDPALLPDWLAPPRSPPPDNADPPLPDLVPASWTLPPSDLDTALPSGSDPPGRPSD